MSDRLKRFANKLGIDLLGNVKKLFSWKWYWQASDNQTFAVLFSITYVITTSIVAMCGGFSQFGFWGCGLVLIACIIPAFFAMMIIMIICMLLFVLWCEFLEDFWKYLIKVWNDTK